MKLCDAEWTIGSAGLHAPRLPAVQPEVEPRAQCLTCSDAWPLTDASPCEPDARSAMERDMRQRGEWFAAPIALPGVEPADGTHAQWPLAVRPVAEQHAPSSSCADARSLLVFRSQHDWHRVWRSDLRLPWKADSPSGDKGLPPASHGLPRYR